MHRRSCPTPRKLAAGAPTLPDGWIWQTCGCQDHPFAECCSGESIGTAAMLDDKGDLLVFAHPPDMDGDDTTGAVPIAVIDALRAERMLWGATR